MSPTRLQLARNDITGFFSSSNKKVYKRSDIDKILTRNRDYWKLTESTTGNKFIEYLVRLGKIREHVLAFPHKKEIRYTWGLVSDFQIIESLRLKSYFTHFTALHLHELTDQIPKTVYLNFEQPAKRGVSGQLAQDRIDLAFRNACRVSKTIAEFHGNRICILNGRFAGQKGVITVSDEFGELIRISNLERTLIDCVVRPVYSGGVHSVLTAFKRAADDVSINKLTATLSSLNYIYPYHQAVGFYLERSGKYTESQISLIDVLEKKFDFYLCHQMKQKEYSNRWKLYYPTGL